MVEPIGLHWATHNRVTVGNAFGYTSASVNLRDAFVRVGGVLDDAAPTALHFCHPRDFAPLPGKRNVLFTMYEGAPVPPEFEVAFRAADLVLVPSHFCRDLFSPITRRTRTPCAVSRLGFDASLFRYRERAWTGGQPFVFLHVGAPNARKGALRVTNAWNLGGAQGLPGARFADQDWCELYLKTTDPTGEGKLVEIGNVTWDSRPWPREQLAALYHAAHCMVLPASGEGFGLPLLEAMATGLPIVTVKWSGPLDFLDSSVAYFCDHTLDEQPIVTLGEDSHQIGWQTGAFADTPSLARTMARVIRDYAPRDGRKPVATERALRGARRAHGKWTWEHAATALMEHLRRPGPCRMVQPSPESSGLTQTEPPLSPSRPPPLATSSSPAS